MGAIDTNNIPCLDRDHGNIEAIKQLSAKAAAGEIVPFIGAGFSKPACPTWGNFLDQFFDGLKREFMTETEAKTFMALKTEGDGPDFEQMANLLMDCAGKEKRNSQIKKIFDVEPTAGMKKKFRALHRAFPGLKITTNFDRLIEKTAPEGSVLDIAHGNNPDELNRRTTLNDSPGLLKIHGCIDNVEKIVLTSRQYEGMYGRESGFDPETALPAFLRRVFTNSSLLFIGCSLGTDRVLEVLNSLDHARSHFALVMKPKGRDEAVLFRRRLSNLHITPIWLTDFSGIDALLAVLAGKETEATSALQGIAFVGREGELKQIKEAMEQDRAAKRGSMHMITGRLFAIEGAGGVGKTALAIEAARQMGHRFPDGVVGPVRVAELEPPAFAKILAEELGMNEPEPPDNESANALVSRIMAERYMLLVLDNAESWDNLRWMLPRSTPSMILVTSRFRELFNRMNSYYASGSAAVHDIRLERFSEEEALAMFKKRLNRDYRQRDEALYLEISGYLGFLPLALGQAIALMTYGPHYSAARLAGKLAEENRLELLNHGAKLADSDKRTIETVYDLSSGLLDAQLTETLEFLAVCAPGWVSAEFMIGLAKDESMPERLEQLHARSWCHRHEDTENGAAFYELHQLVRELVKQKKGNRMQEPFMEWVDEIFLDEDMDFRVKDALMPQLEEVISLAEMNRDRRLKKWLYNIYKFCEYRGYGHFYVRLTEIVETLFSDDPWSLRVAYSHRALIFKRWGKLKEAMILHKKQEVICHQVSDLIGLSKCYSNQALILMESGELEEAMTLHKKSEAICIQLGDLKGLAKTFANQALILKAWGNLDEAMILHKKHEEICTSLNDLEGLAKSYGHQAVILSTLNKFDEAMALCKKEEAIFEQLGDRIGLARNYSVQGVIHYYKKEFKEAMELYKKEEMICHPLGDRAGLARSYGNQALILMMWGKIEGAMTLHKKDEEIKRRLGDREGLAGSWWNQGIIQSIKGDKQAQIQLWHESIQMKKSLGIPTEDDEKKLEELLKNS